LIVLGKQLPAGKTVASLVGNSSFATFIASYFATKSNPMKINAKSLALGGIAGPALFTTMTLVCSALRPDYDHGSQFISELGATSTPHAQIMNYLGFIPSGVMILALGLAILLMLGTKASSRVGAIFIMLFGVGMTLAGIFACDAGCPPQGSLESTLHDRISGITFMSAVIGTMLLGIAFRDLDRWRPVWLYSVVTSVASFYFIIAIIDSTQTRSQTGIWQRLLLLTLFLWFGTVGYRLFRSDTSAPPVSG
jgi:hypothetical membrane protein